MSLLSDSVASRVLRYYESIIPLLVRHFAGIPIVAASFPDGSQAPPRWFGPHENALTWLLHRGAIEFHSWTPIPGDPLRARFGRVLLELEPGAPLQKIVPAAYALRDAIASRGLHAIPVLSGESGVALWIPFDDGPQYAAVRGLLHDVADEAIARHPDILTADPLVRCDGRVHVHVSSNAPGRFSALPYSLRGDDRLSVCAPLHWDEIDRVLPGSVNAESFANRFAAVGDVFGEQLRGMHRAQIMATPATQPERGHVLGAVLDVLSDGVARTADEILAEAQKRGTLSSDVTRKYVYTALIEYIARTQGRKRKPLIVQNPDRRFRINEPPDAWPNTSVPQLPPDPGGDALCARLEQTSRGDDPTAFEQAVCDAFEALGFAATHIGGNDAPDGYADAILGPMQYRVMLECKTARAQVTQPDCFEASKYRGAYGADYCAILGPEFSGELEFASELQTHGVSAWTVDDLRQMLTAGATAYELRDLFAPGFAADRVSDLLWDRKHGDVKQLKVICDLLRSAGWAMQMLSARANERADAAAITLDVALGLVDGALSAQGAQVGCTRDQIRGAFEYLTSPLVRAAAWIDDQREAIVIIRPGA
ncbi:MAG TPA: hypothetical protein VKT72_00235 [Candidatus Baltobacteraceae bacterium]|nr:hypothetical protein [Candidatus Baltobacteraceae bacterium]